MLLVVIAVPLVIIVIPFLVIARHEAISYIKE